jgi:hypothetical protein
MSAVFAAAIFLLGTAIGAEKTPRLRDFPFWTAPKQPHARAFVPGLQAGLQLTPEQIAKIEEACRETIDQPDAKGKNAPKFAEAQEKLFQRVAGIITDEQKKQSEKENDAWAKAVSAVAEDLEPQFIAAKGNAEETAKLRAESQKRIREEFEKKLDGILSNEQREAVKKAAEIEKKQAEEKPNKVKPNK